MPSGQGQVFLEWSLDSRDEYRVVLSEDTPGTVEELDLEELEPSFYQENTHRFNAQKQGIEKQSTHKTSRLPFRRLMRIALFKSL